MVYFIIDALMNIFSMTNLLIHRLLTVNGSCRMAQGSWAISQGSWCAGFGLGPKGHGLGQAPSLVRLPWPRAMSPEP